LQVGDLLTLAPGGIGIPVAILEPQQALVLHGDTRENLPGMLPALRPGDYMLVNWGFYLRPDPDGSTRLIERWLADWNASPFNSVVYRAFMEPGAFIMERRMLLGIKERTEAL
jgi:hypothetical protein